MTEDKQDLWSEEVRERLVVWANWTRGNQLVRGTKNVLADMIQKAAGEVPGSDSGGGYEFTFEIEAVDKSVARMKMEANRIGGRQKTYIKSAKRVLMSTYLGQRGTAELAETMDCSVDHVKALLWYAESFVGRALPQVEKDLQLRKAGVRIAHV